MKWLILPPDPHALSMNADNVSSSASSVRMPFTYVRNFAAPRMPRT